MKSVFVSVVSLLLMGSIAEASKARLSALQGASFLKDSQTIFVNPSHVNSLGQYLTFEMGSSSATAATRSEGGFMRKDGEWNYGVYLGHQNDTQTLYRSTTLSGVNGGGSYLRQQNPVEVFFGKQDWGMSVGFSNSNKKTTSQKEQSFFVRYGKDMGDIEFFGTLEVIGSAEDTGNKKVTSAPVLTVGGEKNFGRYYGTAALRYGQIKGEPTPDKTATDTTVELSIADLSLKTDTRLLYYGASLGYSKVQGDGKSLAATNLPIYLGLETELNAWATFRGSVSQTFLIGSTKNEFATAPSDGEDTLSNNTTVSLGVGIKYAGFVLDGTLASSTSGDINGNDVLSKAAVTYAF